MELELAVLDFDRIHMGGIGRSLKRNQENPLSFQRLVGHRSLNHAFATLGSFLTTAGQHNGQQHQQKQFLHIFVVLYFLFAVFSAVRPQNT